MINMPCVLNYKGLSYTSGYKTHQWQ